jgi:glycolate oxidase
MILVQEKVEVEWVMYATIKQSLKEIVGEENFSDSLIDLIAYSKDASEHQHRPEAAVWPANTEQVVAIMKLANQKKIVIVPRGAGTSLAGTAVPRKGGIILDLCRMDKIIEINIEDRLVVVQPGVIYADLDRALSPYGFFFPPDPASASICSLGGNVATNAGGIKGAKYGNTKDYVLALEAVLPGGRILHTGTKCMKSSSGYDLTKLLVGSEGTLAVITEITLKVSPKPAMSSTAMATFETLEDAGRAINEIMYSGIIPSALEIMDQQILTAINENTDLGLPVVEAMLVAETDGYTKEENEFQMKKIIEIFKRNHAATVEHTNETGEEAAELWAARKSAYGVLARMSNNLIVEDMGVPMSKIPEMLRFIADLAKKHDLKIPTAGHAGDGNLHPVVCFDATDPQQVKRVEEASVELFEKVRGLGGTLTGEHGIGLAKVPFVGLEHDETSMDMMRAIKKSFDPNNILNPGKMGLET